MSTLEELEHEAAEIEGQRLLERITLIAKVLAWQDGCDREEIDAVSLDTGFMDAAQQCAEDLGLA